MSAEEIKQLRHSLGMTQQQLADKLGVGIATIKRWEGGKSRVPRHVIEYLKGLAESGRLP